MLQTECWLGCRCGCCSVFITFIFCFSAYGMQHAAGFEVLRRLTRALSSRRLQTSSNSRRCKVHLPHSRNACVSVFWSAVDCVRAICIYAKHLAAPQSSQKSETATGQTHMLHSPLIYADCPPSLSDCWLVPSVYIRMYIRLCEEMSIQLALSQLFDLQLGVYS